MTDTPAPVEQSRWVLTCEPCRFGRHDECRSLIIISAGALTGSHRCACTAPHPKPTLPTKPAA